MTFKVFYLSADTPIAKRYELDSNGKLIKHQYPFIYEFTSHERLFSNLNEFAASMVRQAGKNRCLVKGMLNKNLVSESRAGSTNPADLTNWVCLDFDGIENFVSVDAALAKLGCGDTSYILQWSSSQGIESTVDIRCHVFMELEQPAHPQILKHWLMDLNLTHLPDQLKLTKTSNALKWPLDVTTCQNDKLIYISPPILGLGVKDPHPANRITYEKRAHDTLILPKEIPTGDALRFRAQQAINALRSGSGLPAKKKTQFKLSSNTEYMANPDSADVTGIKHERGFTYFNLNGGDSWAYYHPDDNQEFIYNFKGEPTYRTEDLLPAYWAQLLHNARQGIPDHQGRVYFAFRDFSSSNYYNGIYDTGTQDLEYSLAKSENQLRHFMKQHGQPIGDIIFDGSLVFDPLDKTVYDPVTRRLNTFKPTELKPEGTLLPPITKKLIEHVLGNDLPTIEHFHNWFACVVQYMTRTGTAWVMHGTQGTGKGLLFHNILAPILGVHNTTTKRMEELESEFTGFMENKFLVFVDEIQAGRGVFHDKVTAKLKNLIVEPNISIRKMYHAHYTAKNFSNFIFASNKSDPVEIAQDDRRFNVGIYQPQQITSILSNTDIEALNGEAAGAYGYFLNRPADPERARTPHVSAARAQLIDISTTSIDVISKALRDGNLEFFWDQLNSTKMQMLGLSLQKYLPYLELMKELVKIQEPKLTREELFIICDWCIDGIPRSPHKFTSLLKHHRIHMGYIWKHGRTARGIEVNWQVDANWLIQVQAEIAKGVV